MLLRGVGSMGGVAPTYHDKVIDLGPIGYWPLNEASGTTIAAEHPTTLFDGTYTGVTVNSTASPIDADNSPYWDGANDYGDLYSTALQAALNGSSGTISMWVKNELVANIGYLFFFWNTPSSDRLECFHNGTTLTFFHRADGITDDVKITTAFGSTGWVHWAFTWDQSETTLRMYRNSTQLGSTSLGGVFAAEDLQTSRATIGAGFDADSPFSILDGHISHYAMFDTVLSDAQIVTLASTLGA